MARKLKISTGRSRLDKRWKQREVTWERLKEKLSETHRTAEKESEYHIASRDRQTEIKDIGGFVGGLVEGGQRKKGAVKIRSMLTLDIDYAKPGIWDDITLDYDFACLIYSTHSSTRKMPRLRLIIPLSRDTDRDEYEALARLIAGGIGIDQFDDSTYQAERLMFWPSTPKDGEYIYEAQDGDFLDVDEYLNEGYTDWKDSSQWPVSSRVADVVRRELKQQADPLTKPGIVGRFCRAYDIHDAINTFLPDDYEVTSHDANRYTYVKGTTAGGLVTYEDKFAYSHHGTDPTGGMLCNAFDLVRIHLYGDLDENSRQEDVMKKPSWKKMEELISTDERVRAEDNAELAEQLKNDFGDILEEAEATSGEAEGTVATSGDTERTTAGKKKLKPKEDNKTAWMTDLDRTKDGSIKNNVHNTLLIMNNTVGKALRRDDLARLDIITRSLPWRKLEDSGSPERFWTNDDDARLLVWMEGNFGITGKERVLNCKTVVSCTNRFHPIKDYLESLTWDGKERMESLFIDYLGAEDDELTRAVTRKALVAAVARIYEPGCKYDYITVLQGPEGIGKSSLLGILGGKWFNDSVSDLAGDKGMEQIQGCWIIEAGELQSIKRNEVEAVKAFVSRQVDSFRPAYGRVKETMPRQCVFFATTNEGEFLRGNNGNRRFWVIPCTKEHHLNVWDMTDEDRDQIWAEARLRYESHEEDLYLPYDLETKMRERQQMYNEIQNDPRVGLIQEYLDKKLPVEWGGMDANERTVYLADEDAIEARGVNQRQFVCVAEVLQECLHERLDEKSKYKSQEIVAILAKIPGWEKLTSTHRFGMYGIQKGYKRVNQV